MKNSRQLYSLSSMDEIPVAQRKTRKIQTSPSTQSLPFTLLLVLSSALITITLFWLLSPKEISQSPESNLQPVETLPITPEKTSSPEETVEIPPHILGHLSYEQAPVTDLKSITSDGRIKLRTKAAERFLQMQSDARTQGVILVAISGFRTFDEQEYLFFGIKEQRNQDASKRAEVSAPPGYSEHHTGYAVDIGDGNAPATNLSTKFEQTSAFRWLEANASKYSFELSFPPDNLQGISYEPWHWRFVGDSHSLETFYKARALKLPLPAK